jgi:hypothetical protein
MDLFTNRTPTDVQGEALDQITDAMHAAAGVLEELLPSSRYKSLAFTKLEECSMWAKKAAVFTIEELPKRSAV